MVELTALTGCDEGEGFSHQTWSLSSEQSAFHQLWMALVCPWRLFMSSDPIDPPSG